MEYGFMSVVPPLTSVIIAIVFKNVFVALATALFLANLIIFDWNIFEGLQNTLLSVLGVFKSTGSAQLIFTVILIGGLLYVMEQSGGVQGFVDYLTTKRSGIKSKKAASIFTWIIGIISFTSGTVSLLITGAVSKPINDALRVTPERTAFIVHSTATPWSLLVPISIWGPIMLGIIQSATGSADASGTLLQSIYLNLYCILAVFGTLAIVLTDNDFGPMKAAIDRHEKKEKEYFKTLKADSNLDVKIGGRTGRASYLIVPMLVMIITIVTVFLGTGHGNFLKGDGYSAVLWSAIAAVASLGVLIFRDRVFKFQEFIEHLFQGCGNSLLLPTILLFAYSLGNIVKVLDTGTYLASVFSQFLSPSLLPLLVFLMCCIISFSTGTSLGTATIMGPIAFAMAVPMGANLALTASAVWGGSVFGDHASPISDSTIISSSFAGCSVESHFRTQLPYTLIIAGISVVYYLVIGFII